MRDQREVCVFNMALYRRVWRALTERGRVPIIARLC